MELSQKEFQAFSSLIYKLSGINLHEGKKKLLEARLSKRLKATGITSVKDYLALIRRDKEELKNLLDAVSTNYTYFFRESRHFECLQPQHTLIWSAGCASGEEPYSIAIYCLERGFRPNILATDISIKALSMARQGIYPLEKVKFIDSEILRKYFKKGVGRWEGHVRVKPELRQMVIFKRFNLLKGKVPREAFHVIFCRNVMIYFDQDTKGLVVNKLYEALKWDGLLVIGGAESLNGIAHPFRYIKPSVYQKVARQANNRAGARSY